MPEAKVKQYKVLVGMNYVPDGKKEEVRAEVDDVVTDLSKGSVKSLLDQGCIEEVK